MLAKRFDHDGGVSPATIRSLRDRIDLLEEENRQLREAAEVIAPFPSEWKLTKYEARLLSALMRARAGRMSNERLLTALYGLEPDVQIKIIDVWVCKLRKKLAAAGADIEIRTFWGEGFGLSTADRDKLTAILASEPSPEARYEREVQKAVADATADLEARLWAVKAENDRLRDQPAWKRYAKPEKARAGAGRSRTSGGGRR